MCEPATIIAGAGLALGAGSAIAQHKAQANAAKANKQAAMEAMTENWRALSLQEVQAEESTSQSILQVERDSRVAAGLARVSAAEAGVEGASVEALLADFGRSEGEFKVIARKNLEAEIDQLQEQKRGATATAQSRIAAVPNPNPFALGLQIGATALDFASSRIKSKPTPAAASTGN